MTFRKSLTTLAAVALIAFAVTIAQAGSGCAGQTQAAGGCKGQAAGAGCGHGQMNAEGGGAGCQAHGAAGGACMGHMQGAGGCKDKASADCCKDNKMMGGDARGMRGGMRGMDCMKMMQRGMCDARSMDDKGCNWNCNGIWGDYDCSNPGGSSLLNCGSRKSCRMMVICGDDEEGCEKMMRKMGCGEGGMMMRKMDCGPGGMKMGKMDCGPGGMMMGKDGGCCAGGPKMERKIIMMHKHDGACKPGCMGMGQGAAGTPPPCGTPPPATKP